MQSIMFYTVVVEVNSSVKNFTYFKKDYVNEEVAWKSFWRLERALEHAGYWKWDWSSDDPDASQTLILAPADGDESNDPWIYMSRLVSDFADEDADDLDPVKAYCDIKGYVTGELEVAPSYDNEALDCDLAF